MMAEDVDTEVLAEAQRRREQQELEQARATDAEPEAQTHQRRAEKAHYLHSKLQERAEAEREGER